MRISPDVVFRELGDAAVLVDLASNEIFELNATGAAIWTLVAEGQPIDTIVEHLVSRFDVDPPTARRECDRLLGELRARRLLV